MSGIASIGTATNSNLAGAGPSINMTGRADLTTISMFSNSDSDLKNGQHDIKRHEICLSVPQRQIQAYSAVFSFDPFVEMPLSLTRGIDFVELPTADLNSVLDMNISRYYRDVGDARNDLEYILAKQQISLHSLDQGRNRCLLLSQDRLLKQGERLPAAPPNAGAGNAGGAAAAGNGAPVNITHRRNAVFLSTDEQEFTIPDPNHPGVWEPVDHKGAVGHGYPPMYRFVAVQGQGPNRANQHNSNVFGIHMDLGQNGGSHDIENMRELTNKLDSMIRYIMSVSQPRVHTEKNRCSAPIEPPDLVYAGMALTDACAHPQNGDTAVTLNIFSALTVDNGPFSILTNDDLMWIHDIELPDFERDGMRRQRNLLDLQSILLCLNPATAAAFTQDINLRQAQFDLTRNKTPIINALKHKPGNPSRKTFLIAPQKKGFGLLHRSSIKDKMRHIGTSISSCMPSKRLDLVNGAVAKF